MAAVVGEEEVMRVRVRVALSGCRGELQGGTVQGAVLCSAQLKRE
jgi:hypothetical protein